MARTHHAIYRPFDGVAGITRILKSRCGPARKVALLYVLEGLSYRKAESATGGQDDVALFRNAERMGLQRLHNQRKSERDAWLCNAEEAAAIEDPLQLEAVALDEPGDRIKRLAARIAAGDSGDVDGVGGSRSHGSEEQQTTQRARTHQHSNPL